MHSMKRIAKGWRRSRRSSRCHPERERGACSAGRTMKVSSRASAASRGIPFERTLSAQAGRSLVSAATRGCARDDTSLVEHRENRQEVALHIEQSFSHSSVGWRSVLTTDLQTATRYPVRLQLLLRAGDRESLRIQQLLDAKNRIDLALR